MPPPARLNQAVQFVRTYRAPLLVLALALTATGLAAYSVSLTARSRDDARLLTAIRWTRDVIQQRLNIYVNILEAEAALFAVNNQPTAPEFRSFLERLQVQESFPGIQGVGFAKRVLPAELEQVTERLRKEVHAKFNLTPPGPREEYFPIVYLEPLDRRNERAIGFDMFSEPVRREAMARARDQGIPSASSKVQLVQEIDPVKQAGFLLYIPVYKGGTIPQTLKERQRDIIGFAYSPFRADDLFQGIFGGEQHPDVHINVYDGETVAPDQLLHASRVTASETPLFHRAESLPFAGHTWTLEFQTTPAFDAGSYQSLVPWVGGMGFLLSLTLCAITAALARAHQDLQTAQAELKAHTETLERTVASRTARLQETISELEQISYSMVHDMRAPLRAIQSFASLLEDEAGPALTEQGLNYINRMKTATSRMDALIRDVLNYGKLVREELPLHRMEVAPLVWGIVDTYPMFKPEAAHIEVDPHIPPVVANEGALTLCISNLLSNAVKFARPGQKPVVHIRGERHNGWVRICVADEGIGIPAEMRGKLFGLFQKLDNSPDGTGMGLAIVRKAAERMGGKVYLDAEVQQGTRVCLELKAAQ